MEEHTSRDQRGEPHKKKGDEPHAAKARQNVGSSEGIEELRARLYERGGKKEMRARHPLSGILPGTKRHTQSLKGQEIEANRRQSAEGIKRIPTANLHTGEGTSVQNDHTVPPTPLQTGSMAGKKRSKRYRLIIVLVGLAFFVGALGISTLLLMGGTNQISGENITIGISGPFSIGGGQKIPLQIAIANQNTVPVEAATLIIDYPPGTQSATELGREIFSDRKQLNNIEAGEVINVPIEAIVFGEENEEKTINVSVEYRVRGSNATFFKEAEPLRFKISSSPVVLSIHSVKSISSGQEAEIELTVSSNSPTPLSGVLVKASYPFGFDFTSSDPDTISAQDTWLIESLEPEEETTILLRGVVVGRKDEEKIFSFSVGVPNEQDRFNLASIFTIVSTEIALEEPFFGVGVSINNEESETVIIDAGEAASIEISFTNTLEDTIYDGEIEAKLSGSALNDVEIDAQEGFYDSTTDTIRWDFVDIDDLKAVDPGRKSAVNFNIDPENDIGHTPEIEVEVTVKGKRVFEDRVPQELIGTAFRTIRISSDVELASSALYSEGPFTNTGPIPPVAEEVTQYTFLFSVKNSSNDITGAEMTAVLPQYMTWLDLTTPGDDIVYDSVNRTMTWRIGDIEANGYEEAWVQVSFLPSLSQVGTTPTVLETQRLRATDRFTGAIIRDESSPLTTRLVNDPDSSTHDGEVKEN